MLGWLIVGITLDYLKDGHGWVRGVTILIPVIIVANLAFFLVNRSGVRTLKILYVMDRNLHRLPDDVQFDCRPVSYLETPVLAEMALRKYQEVSVVWFNYETQQEEFHPIYRATFLTWSKGRRLASDLRPRVRWNLVVRAAIFFIVALPSYAITLWFGIAEHWVGYVYFAVLLLSQKIPILLLPAWVTDLLDAVGRL